MDTAVQVPWMVEIGIITWRSVKKEKRPPLPSEILASFIVFGAFSLIPNDRIASLMSWGIVIASALNILPSIVSGPTESLSTGALTPVKGGQQ